MAISCSAYNCTNRHAKESMLKFHHFPVKNIELCKRWVTATKRDNFVPTINHYLCSEHFTADDYVFSNSKRLKENSVPSAFNFPAHLTSKEVKRKLPTTRNVHVDRKNEEQPSTKKIKIVSPSKDDLKMKINEQKNTIKILKQKVRRKETKIKSLSILVEDLTKEKFIRTQPLC